MSVFVHTGAFKTTCLTGRPCCCFASTQLSFSNIAPSILAIPKVSRFPKV